MIEILIIAVLVLWSCFVVFKKLMPKTSDRTFLKLSNLCQHRGWHKLSIWLKPKQQMGCGGNCGCDSSDEQLQKPQEIKSVKWK